MDSSSNNMEQGNCCVLYEDAVCSVDQEKDFLIMDKKMQDFKLIQYALFCGIVKKDSSIVETVINGINTNIEIMNIDYQIVCEIDRFMQEPCFDGNQFENFFPGCDDLLCFIKSWNYPVLYLCCLQDSSKTLNQLISKIKMDTIILRELLNFCCTVGSVQCVEILLHHKVEPRGKDLITTIASYQSGTEKAEYYIAIAKHLLCHGCNPDESDENDCRAIHVAVGKSDSEMTMLLLNYNATINYCYNDDHTPLMIAIKNQSQANIDILINCKKNVDRCYCTSTNSPLGFAVEFGNIAILLKLLESDLSSSINIYQEVSPITLAASRGSLVMLWLLLCYGGDVNAKNNFNNDSVLLALTRRNNLIGVQLLLRYGADIKMENKLGCTPLWLAVSENFKELVQLFLYVNSPLNGSCNEYMIYYPMTAVMVSIYKCHFDILELLLNAGGIPVTTKIYRPDPQLEVVFHKNPQVQEQLMKWIETPKSLKWMCRNIVRKCIGERIDIKINKFRNYPPALKSYILLSDLVHKDQIPSYLSLVPCLNG